MEALDFEGMFWVASHPENRVIGRLQFDPVVGGRLTVHGTFYEESLAIDEGNHPPTNVGRILGSARGPASNLGELLVRSPKYSTCADTISKFCVRRRVLSGVRVGRRAFRRPRIAPLRCS